MSSADLPDCPYCGNANVMSLSRGRKAAVMLGGLAGGISSAASVWSGARIGATVGSVAGPTGSLLSAVAGAVLAALAGGAAGCAAGAVVGDLVDDKVLKNYRCLYCDHRFSQSSPPVAHGTSSDMTGPPAQTPTHHHHPQSRPPSQDFGAVHFLMESDDEPYGFYRPFPHHFSTTHSV